MSKRSKTADLKTAPGTTTTAGMGILLAIPVLLLAAIVLKGRSYNPAYFTPPAPPLEQQGPLPLPNRLGDWSTADSRWFPDERMYEAINGKAQFYQKFGVEGLQIGTWTRGDEAWQVYLFVMDTASAAEGAFAAERPEEATAIAVGNRAYTVPGALMAQHGPYYVQLVAMAANAEEAPGLQLAELILRRIAPQSGSIGTSKPGLPDAYRESGSAGFHPEDAFGYTSLAGVQFAAYTVHDERATWFMAEGNAETVSAYSNELARYGADGLFSRDGAVGGNMFGSWEMLGLAAGSPIGVRNAGSRQILIDHWDTWKRLREEQP